MPRALLSLLLCFQAGPAPQAQETFTAPTVHVTAIELVADVRDRQGNVPPDLTASDFIVLEDAVEQRVIGVEGFGVPVVSNADQPAVTSPRESPAIPEWRIVIYFDLFLSGRSLVRETAALLQNQAETLARLGSVDVVVANPARTNLLTRSRDPLAIRAALRDAGSRATKNWVTNHRRQYLTDRDEAALFQTGSATDSIEPLLVAEVDAISRFRSAVLETVSRYPRRNPSALLLVSDGFELNISDFYRNLATSPRTSIALQSGSVERQLSANMDSFSKALAADGWILVAVHGSQMSGEQWLDDTQRTNVGRTKSTRVQPLSAMTMANQPLEVLAEETGGTSGTGANLASALTSLQQRTIITYQVARPPDGRARRVEVRSRREGVVVRTARWSGDATSEDVAAARTAALLRGETDRAELPVSIDVKWNPKRERRRTGEVTIKAGPLASFGESTQRIMRVTVTVDDKRGRLFTSHRLVTARPDGSVFYRAPISVNNPNVTIAATVEELETGIWGGTVAH